MGDFRGELERAATAYAARDRGGGIVSLYDPLRPSALFRLQEREWVFASLFRRAGVTTLGDREILEVGCGSAASLARFTGLGADPARLHGIDLSADRVAAGRERLPQADLRIGSAHELPWADGTFDVVAQLTLFSSVVDRGLQAVIAREMLRVLKPGGVILWYEAHRARRTPDFEPVPPGRLRELFPGCAIDLRTVTLRWELIDRLTRHSRWAGLIAESVPVLRSHHAAIIRPPR